VALGLVALLSAGSIFGAARQVSAKSEGSGLERLVPQTFSGLELRREPMAEAPLRNPGADALVTTGRVWSIRHDGVIEGSVQVSQLKPDVDHNDPDLLRGLEQGIGGGPFNLMEVPAPLWDGNCRCRGQYHLVRVEDEAAYYHQHAFSLTLPEQRVYLWLSPDGRAIVLVSVRKAFTEAASNAFVLDLIHFQHGHEPGPVPVPAVPRLLVPAPVPAGSPAP